MTCSFSNRGTGSCRARAGLRYPDRTRAAATASKSRSRRWATGVGEGTSEASVIVSAAEASMRAYSPTLTYSQVQGCITSTLANGGNLDVAAAFNACGLGQVVSEGMAAYRAANLVAHPAEHRVRPRRRFSRRSRHVSRSRGSPRSRSRRTALTITVAEIPKGLRLQLVVQRRGKLGRLVTVAQITTGHRTITLRVNGGIGSWRGSCPVLPAPGGGRDPCRVRQARRST